MRPGKHRPTARIRCDCWSSRTRAASRTDPDSLRTHGANAVHVLPWSGAQHGGRRGGHAGNRHTRAGMRRLPSAQLRFPKGIPSRIRASARHWSFRSATGTPSKSAGAQARSSGRELTSPLSQWVGRRVGSVGDLREETNMRTWRAMTWLLLAALVAFAGPAAGQTTGPAPLAGTSWQLVRFQGSDDTVVTPDDGSSTRSLLAATARSQPGSTAIAAGGRGHLPCRVSSHSARWR